MMDGLLDEIVVIVGGSGGIGKEAALLFARQGAQVVLMARGTQALQETAHEIQWQGGKADIVSASVTDPKAIQKAVEHINAKYGKIDVLIYSAAGFYLSPAETMDLRVAKQVMDVNYWGALYTTQAFLPLVRMGKRKSMVYISSLSVQCTPAFFTAYAAPKHALRGFLLSLRQELRPEGIHVGMVSPGPVYTPLIEKYLHQNLYRLPWGIPVLKPKTAAQAVLRVVLKRKVDLVIPRRLGLAAQLSNAFPSLLETYYRITIPAWNKLLKTQVQELRRDTLAHTKNLSVKSTPSDYRE